MDIRQLPDDQYTEIFRQLSESAQAISGIRLPKYIEIYGVLILADHMRRNRWEPDPSFAECYMTLRDAAAARDFGDECLFMCGVFPEYASRRGLTTSYYQSLGQGAYLRAAKDLERDLFECLAKNFSVVSRWMLTVTRQQNYPK